MNPTNEQNLEDIPEKLYDANREHSTPEQMLMRMAIENLDPEQRRIWDWHAYEGLTQEEIGERLGGLKHNSVSDRIHTIEKKIGDWCRQNRGAYMLLKLDQKLENDNA